MPKPKKLGKLFIKDLEGGENTLAYCAVSNTILCQCCSSSFAYDSNITHKITQHLKTGKHKQNVSNCAARQQLLSTSFQQDSAKNKFFEDITSAFIEANIPLYKVNHPSVKRLLEQYTGKSVPDESTLRKNYVTDLYKQAIAKVKAALQGRDIYVILDETTDATGKCIVGVLAGVLDGVSLKTPYLVEFVEVEKVNSAEVVKVLHKSLNRLFQGQFEEEHLRAIISDGASYMLKAGRLLKETVFPHILHVTCLAHALQRVILLIKDEFSAADMLISLSKVLQKQWPKKGGLQTEDWITTSTRPRHYPLGDFFGCGILFLRKF